MSALPLATQGAAPLASNSRAELSPNCILQRPARHDAPETSRLAARSAANRSAQQRATILAAIAGAGAFGATDAELEVLTGLRAQSVSPRRGEAAKLGLIVQNGKRRKTPRGCWATVWVVPDALGAGGREGVSHAV